MKKGFTLIELLAVIVILAIIAIIAVPIVLNIISDAKKSSDEESIKIYGKAVENYIGEYLLNNKNNSGIISYNDIKPYIKTRGNNVECQFLKYNSKSIVLGGCSVGNSRLYKYKNGQVFEQQDKYEIGDIISINGVEFYVIKNNDVQDNYLVALKKDALTISEVNKYKYDKNRIVRVNRFNRYYSSTHTGEGEASDLGNNIGGLAYYTNETCHNSSISNVVPGCTVNYEESDIKYVIDNWASDQLKDIDIKEVRLINEEDLKRLNYDFDNSTPPSRTLSTPDWLDNINYLYWTDIAYGDVNNNYVFYVYSVGFNSMGGTCVYYFERAARPVISVNKFEVD